MRLAELGRCPAGSLLMLVRDDEEMIVAGAGAEDMSIAGVGAEGATVAGAGAEGATVAGAGAEGATVAGAGAKDVSIAGLGAEGVIVAEVEEMIAVVVSGRGAGLTPGVVVGFSVLRAIFLSTSS